MLKRLPLILLPALAALILSACGGSSGDSVEEGGLAAMAPAEAEAYFEIAIGSEAAGKTIEEIAARFPGGDDLSEQVNEELDEVLGGLSFESDVQPWLGDRAAVFLTGIGAKPEATAIIETTDPEAAAAALERIAGVDSEGDAASLIGDYVVLGPEAGVEMVAAVADGEDPLGSVDGFTFEVGDVDGSDALAFAWLDWGGAATQAIQADIEAALDAELIGELIARAGFDSSVPMAMALTSVDDEVILDTSVGISESYEPLQGVPASGLPAKAIFAARCRSCARGAAVAIDAAIDISAAADGTSPEEADAALEGAYGITPAELEESLGDAGIFVEDVRGGVGGGIGGGVVLEVEDPAPVEEALEALPPALTLGAPELIVGGLTPAIGRADGFSVGAPPLRAPLYVAFDGERLVLGVGEEATVDALDAAATGSGPETVDVSALSGFTPTARLDVPALLDVASASPELAAADPYLSAIDAVATGSHVDGERLIVRTVLIPR